MLSFRVIVAIRPHLISGHLRQLFPVTILSTKSFANTARMNTCESLSKQRTLTPMESQRFAKQGMGIQLWLTSFPLPNRRLRDAYRDSIVSAPFCYHPASHLRPCRRGRRDEF